MHERGEKGLNLEKQDTEEPVMGAEPAKATALPLVATMPSNRGQTLRAHSLLWSPCFEPPGHTVFSARVFFARKRILGPR